MTPKLKHQKLLNGNEVGNSVKLLLMMVVDLGNNILLVKNERILGDFSSSTQSKAYLLSSICLSERKCNSLELDSQGANVTAEECGCVDASDDP